MLRLTASQLDFILEMYASDNPKEYQFVRAGKGSTLTDSERQAAWEAVLLGNEHEAFMSRRMPSPAVLARIRAMQNAALDLVKSAQPADGAKRAGD